MANGSVLIQQGTFDVTYARGLTTDGDTTQEPLVRPFQDMATCKCVVQAPWYAVDLLFQSYTFDPFANISHAQKHLVLGGMRVAP